jgi:hypothetical protein
MGVQTELLLPSNEIGVSLDTHGRSSPYYSNKSVDINLLTNLEICE